VIAFCTHFIDTLKNVAGLPKHTKVRKLLIALNKIHPLDRIQINLHITGGMEPD